PNQGEAEALTGIAVHDVESARRAADELRGRGATVAIVKLGADGAYASSPEFAGHFPPFNVSPVATVAAGDAFNGGLAVGLAEGMKLRDAVWLAMASGASSVTRAGAQESMGRREEVDRLLASRTSVP
ncbi:MAG: PfkB family carbohydrate kinase, partial [Chloroflexota bacterium]